MTILNNINDDNLLNDIFHQELIVFEDVKGFEIFVKWDGEDFIIKTEINADPINIIDESIEAFFGKAFRFFNSLSDRVKTLLNKKAWYIFQYFPNIEEIPYSKRPKNNLVLTSIYKGGRFNYTVEQIEEFARLFDVECLPFIFKGKLDDKSIEAIKYFLNTSEDDLEYIFGEKSFAFFFYKLLNPQLSHSFLMNDEFNNNMEKIILKVGDNQESFAILNPLYKKISQDNLTEYAEIYSLILVNFLNFCQSVNLEEIKLKGEKRDEIYTYLICKLFNFYISEVMEDILNFDFIVPEFFNKSKFRINKETIPNKITIKLIEESPKFEYLFKCIYFSFRYQMKESIGILTDNMLNIFNKYITELNNRIDIFLNKKSEFELGKKGLVDFGDFFDIKYDKDSEGNVYPTILDEIRQGGEEKKKKKEPVSKSPLK